MRYFSLALLLCLSSFVQSAVAPLDHIAVIVDDAVILQSDIDKRIADIEFQFNQRHVALPNSETLRKQVIEQLILESLQINLAIRAGIRIDDNELNAAMTKVAQQNGLSLQAFQQKLDNTKGSSYAEVREQIKRELMTNQLRTRRMQERIRITDQDVDNFLKSPAGQAELATEYRIGHILINLPEEATPSDIAAGEAKAKKALAELQAGHDFAQVAASYSDAETALRGGDIGWRKIAELPTLFAEKIDHLNTGDIVGPLRTPGGFHILKLLEKRGGEEVKIKQWHTAHILIKPSEILSSENARQKLEDIRQRILKGEKFSDDARIYSEDPGSARQGGDLGWVSAGDMVPEFDKVMQETPLNTLSEVFQTPYGWHLLEVTGIRDQDVSAQYRKAMARQALYLREFDEEAANWLRELRNDAFVEIRN
jgi:peptidyl-prolyl cis-trans isomerase SurA